MDIRAFEMAKKLELSPLYQETLDEYMATYDEQSAKVERFDARIEEITSQEGMKDQLYQIKMELGISGEFTEALGTKSTIYCCLILTRKNPVCNNA